MHLFFAADHAGYLLKNDLKDWAHAQGYATTDLGAYTADSTDYPDYGAKMALALEPFWGISAAAMGILVCGSGVGISIAANRFSHVRSTPTQDPALVRLARQHNDINVLALGARLVNSDQAKICLEALINTPFEGGRHTSRVEKLSKLPK